MKYRIVRVGPVHPDALAANMMHLRKLTIAERDSDMNRLLDEVERGAQPHLLAAAFARGLDMEIVGWAVVERWKKMVLISSFVAPDHRGQQISLRMLQTVITAADRGRVPVVFNIPAPETLFWARFGIMMHPINVPGRME